MGLFTDDVKLLVELDAIIKEQERAANIDPAAKMIASALFPGLGKLVPVGQQIAAQKLDVLTRVKGRLTELLDKEHDGVE